MQLLRLSGVGPILVGILALTASVNVSAQQFQPPINFRVNPSPTGVAGGDFNTDGRLDLVTTVCGDRTCSQPGSVMVLSGNGRGRFRRTGLFVAGPAHTTADTLASGDFNRDGFPDLVVVNNGISIFGTISILLNDGNGGFEAPVSYSVGGSTPVWVTVGFFNGDQKPDVAVSVTTTDSVAVLLGDGDGTFGPAANYSVNDAPQGIALGDVNGDGRTDIISADQCGADPACRQGTVSVLLGNGDGTFQPKMSFLEGMFPLAVAIADFDGDRHPDLAIANPCGTDPTCVSVGSIGIMLGNGDGTFQAVTNYPATGFDTARLSVGDFNRDRHPDVVGLNVQGSDITVFLGNSDGTLGPGTDYLVDLTPIAVAVGDFNHDHFQDLAVADQNADEISILLNTGRTLDPPAGR
jgi:hypothetical protein